MTPNRRELGWGWPLLTVASAAKHRGHADEQQPVWRSPGEQQRHDAHRRYQYAAGHRRVVSHVGVRPAPCPREEIHPYGDSRHRCHPAPRSAHRLTIGRAKHQPILGRHVGWGVRTRWGTTVGAGSLSAAAVDDVQQSGDLPVRVATTCFALRREEQRQLVHGYRFLVAVVGEAPEAVPAVSPPAGIAQQLVEIRGVCAWAASPCRLT